METMRGILAFVCLFANAFVKIHCIVNFSYFELNANIIGKTCSNKLFELTTIPSLIVCAFRCAEDSECVSFFYSDTAALCDGCRSRYGDQSPPTDDMVDSVYYRNPAAETTTTTTTTTQEPTTTTTTAATSTGDYTYMGCFRDDLSDRPMVNRGYYGYGLPFSYCFDHCIDYAYYAYLAATECFCAPANHPYDKHGTSTTCTFVCGGEPSDKHCGGEGVLSVYKYD